MYHPMALIHTHIHLKFFLRILKSSALLESKNLLLPKIAVMVLFMFSMNTLFEDYLAKFFGFHDLGLINDFLANTVHRGKIFYVSTLGVNHLSWHFSPTLFLITPFYLIFDSQFVFLALNVLAIYFSISLLSKLAFDVLKKNEKKYGFSEAVFSSKNNKKIKFFNLGKRNSWKNLLDPKIEKKVKKAFGLQMEKLGYL